MNQTTLSPIEFTGTAFSKPAWGWTIYEFARNPYFMIILMYLFAPYAAEYIGNTLVEAGERVGKTADDIETLVDNRAQSAFAWLTAAVGVISAITSPLLGAALDKGGRRKPLMALVLFMLCLCATSLWWVVPDGSGWSIYMTMVIIGLGSIMYNYSEILHNSQLNLAARPGSIPYVSGIGLALGNLAVVFLYVILLACFIVPAEFGAPFSEPLFGLNADTKEVYRISGPAVAIWMVLFITPYFLWAHDGGTKGAPWIPAMKSGLLALKDTFKNAQKHIQALKFLLARMLYSDGMSAALYLGAIFISTFLDWHAVEMAIYALTISVFAFLGALIGGFLDKKLGPRNALITEISIIVVVFLFQLSITQQSMFYGMVENFVVMPGEIFETASDLIYLSAAMVLAMAGTAMISSSRSMLVHVAPKDKIGEFFGLYMVVGTVTSWVGPLMVAIITPLFVDQRVGMSSLISLFLAGLIVLFFVDAPKEKTNV